MIEFTSAGKIILQKLAISTGILVPAVIDCPCHNTDKVIYNNGRYICKKCGNPVDILITGNSPRSLKKHKYSLIVDELQPIAEKYVENERLRYTSMIDALTKENEILQERCDKLEKEAAENSEIFETSLEQAKERYESVISSITDSNKQLQKLANNLTADSEQWKESYKTLVQKYRTVKEEKESLEHTKDYFKNQAETLKTVPLNDIANYVLDYMTTLFNAAKDKENAESLRDVIIGRTEYLSMMLESAGINVISHERGSALGNERVDIEFKTTADPELDCKVIKSEHFGCIFKNDLYPMIPERVMVYRYVNPNPETETVSDESEAEKGDAPSEEKASKVEETVAEITAEETPKVIEEKTDQPKSEKEQTDEPKSEEVPEKEMTQIPEIETVSGV